MEEYKDIDYHADPILEGFHILHDRAGVKRRKNIPASENLIRLLNKHGDVFYIVQGNDATDNELLVTTAQKIVDETIKYCGGEGRIIIPEII